MRVEFRQQKWNIDKELRQQTFLLTCWRCSLRLHTSRASPQRTDHRLELHRSCNSHWTLIKRLFRMQSYKRNVHQWCTTSCTYIISDQPWISVQTCPQNRFKRKGWKTHHSLDPRPYPLGKSRCLHKRAFS